MAIWRFPSAELHLDARFGARYEYIHDDTYGLEGWVRPQITGPKQTIPSRGDDFHANHYEAHHALPYGGVGLLARFGETFSLDSEARLMVAVVHDYDDHVQRNKDGTGIGGGVGVLLGLRPTWRLTSPCTSRSAAPTPGAPRSF